MNLSDNMSVSLKCFDSVLEKSKVLKEYNIDKRERQPTEDKFFIFSNSVFHDVLPLSFHCSAS